MPWVWHPLMNFLRRSRERWLEMVNWPGQPTLQHREMLHLCQLSPSCHQWLVQWFLWKINLTCNIKERQAAFWSVKHFWLQISMLNPHSTNVCVWMFYMLKVQTKCQLCPFRQATYLCFSVGWNWGTFQVII